MTIPPASPTEHQETLSAARRYVAAGLSVIPIQRGGTKRPAMALLPRCEGQDKNGKYPATWKPFQNRLPTEQEITRWFGGSEPAAIAIVCGAVSDGVECLDVDDTTIVQEIVETIKTQMPDLAEKLVWVNTPSGGLHIWYRCEPIAGNTVLAREGKSTRIETRGEGGYAVVPGSPTDTHEARTPYKYLHGNLSATPTITLDERQYLLALAQSYDRAEISDLAPRDDGSGLSPADDFDKRGPSWQDLLGGTGCTLEHGDWDFGKLTRPGKGHGYGATIGYCKSKLTNAPLLKVFTTNWPDFPQGAYGKFRVYAITRHQGDAKAAMRDLRQQGYGEPTTNLSTRSPQTRTNHNSNAKPSKSPSTPEYQPFPVDALPETLRWFVEEGSAAIGCDSSYLALPALGIAAGLVGVARRVRLKKSWTEPCVLWLVTVGEPSSMKSPSFGIVRRPLIKLQKQLDGQWVKNMHAYSEALEKWKKADVDSRGDKPEKPKKREIFVSDVTIERLGEILDENPRGALMARDELAAWINSFSKYKGKNGGSDVPQWLELWQAGVLKIHRKMAEPRDLFVPKACCSVVGTIQPGILARGMSGELIDAGGGARLLFGMPPKRQKFWREDDLSEHAESTWFNICERLANLDEFTHQLSKEAKELWIDFYNRGGERQFEETGGLQASLGKLEAYAARLAMLHYLIDCMSNIDDPAMGEIPASSMKAAIALVNWFAVEAERVLAMLGESPDDRELRYLNEKIRTKGRRITARDLQRSNGKKYPTAEAARSALDELVTGGYGTWEGSEYVTE